MSDRAKRLAIVVPLLVGLGVLVRKLWGRSRVATVLFALVAVGAIAWALGSIFSHAAYNPTTYYVDKDSVGGTCGVQTEAAARNAPTAPFCSLEQADTVVAAGSRIYVRRGTYAAQTITAADKTSYVRVQPYPGERPIIQAIHVDGSDGWELNGLEVTGYAGTDPTILDGRIAISGAVKNVRVIGNYIHDTAGGVYFRSGVTNLTISANRIINVSCTLYHGTSGTITTGTEKCPWTKSGYGIAHASGDTKNVQIVRNLIRNTDGDGIQFGCLSGSAGGCLIDGNEIEDASVDFPASGIGDLDANCEVGETLPCNDDHADSLQYASSIDLTVRRNYFHDGGKCTEFGNVSNVAFVNLLFAENLCVNTSNYCFPNIPNSTGITIRNNTCWNTQLGGLNLNGNTQLQAMTGLRIYNNIFGPNTGNDVSSGGLTPATCTCSLWKNNVIVENGTSLTFDASDIVGSTPTFVDTAGQNFTPASGSILVGAGYATATLSATDRRLKPRQVGTVDIGAHERQASDP